MKKYIKLTDEQKQARREERKERRLMAKYASEVLRERMSNALDCMQYLLNSERLAYERYRDSLTEYWQEMHEYKHAEMEKFIDHLREGL